MLLEYEKRKVMFKQVPINCVAITNCKLDETKKEKASQIIKVNCQKHKTKNFRLVVCIICHIIVQSEQ